MSQPNFFCNAGPSTMSAETCAEIALSYKCAPDEDPLTCELCGGETREHYNFYDGGTLQVCLECFMTQGGPQMIRDESARDFNMDQGVEDL